MTTTAMTVIVTQVKDVLSFLTQGIEGRSSGQKMSSDDEQYKSQKFLMHKIPRVLLKVSLAAYFASSWNLDENFHDRFNYD